MGDRHSLQPAGQRTVRIQDFNCSAPSADMSNEIPQGLDVSLCSGVRQVDDWDHVQFRAVPGIRLAGRKGTLREKSSDAEPELLS